MTDAQPDQWYYAINGQQQGPVSQSVLQEMLGSGRLGPGDLVWRAGMDNWVAAGSVPQLMVSAAPPASHPAAQVVVPSPQSLGYGAPASIGYYAPQPGQVRYAGFWLRVVAAILDAILLAVGGMLVGAIFGAILGAIMGASGYDLGAIETAARPLGNVLGIIIGWLYAAFLESSQHQATLGKMALGLRVTDLDGQRISFARATGRHFAKWISALILLIGYIMAGFTEKKQALHDMIASTLVVRK